LIFSLYLLSCIICKNVVLGVSSADAQSKKLKIPATLTVTGICFALSWKDSNYTTSKNTVKFDVVKFNKSHEYSVFIKYSIVVYFGL